MHSHSVSGLTEFPIALLEDAEDEELFKFCQGFMPKNSFVHHFAYDGF